MIILETKRAKVVMLPAKSESNIWKNVDGELGYFPNSVLLPHPELGESQHLYFITDDEIKVGDWFIDDVNAVRQSIISDEEYWDRRKDAAYYKIVATTDKSLMLDYHKSVFKNRLRLLVKQCYSLPQPSKAFIEKYCKVGGIDEVEIETIKTEGTCHKPICDDNCSYPNCYESGESILKVNSHNEITIHAIKNSWNRKEVEEIVDLYEAIIHGNDHVMTFEDMQKRIKEILK